ncbi:MAG: UTP--glucose-1-phosphate uridylyltransferase GalU [Candidatus Altiarchaeota archaeon]|nr:UTP--glucose-1-phosphate uridylyltransferase GalU [Candidatus Altiarchaeota archaeon]
MKAVIPAAGLGTRFLPATKAMPKEMLPLVDKPSIQFVVEECVKSGIDDILIITGRGKRAIEDHFDHSFELESLLHHKGDNELLREVRSISEMADIHFIRQKEALGLGHAVLRAEKHVGDEPFVVLLGDDIVFSKKPCTKHCVELYEKYSGPIIAVEKVPRNMIQHYGVIKGKPLGGNVYSIDDMIEKPKSEDAPSDLGIIGRYVLTPEIFDSLKKTPRGAGGEIQLTDALKSLNKKQKMYAWIIEGVRYDLGNKFDYIRASLDYALMRPDIGKQVREYIRGLKA